MSPPLRVLELAPYPVLPPVAGGKIRIVQLARALARRGVDLTVVAPFHFTQRRALAAAEPFRLRQVPYPPFGLAPLLVDRPLPYGALVSVHPGYGACLPVDPADFDLCQIDHPAFGDLAERLPERLPVVYGSQNVEVDYTAAECRSEAVRRLVARRMGRLEARLVERANLVLACTEGDRLRFEELYGLPPHRCTVAPNGIDLAAVDAALAAADPPRPRLDRRAVFTGSDVAHNRRAVRALVERVAPELAGEVEIVIVGPCARRAPGSSPANVLLDPTGRLADYATPGTVGLNPVEGGSGSSLKLLDTLAHGLPLVSTPFGARGFEELAPWITRTPVDGFAAALRAEVPFPDGLRERLGPYEWSAVGARILEAYGGLR
ncbi:MAG: glycosyltransferase family 4 protein [Planctomycetota bacterium]|jgi:glycosyltransferase involved in cell wall biosynthesis|nr:glycosyltransferase family 4 protein [Planctomycetota bacterium]MDP6764268.1 glycosyltransferase family 4 protein [Planctomycetota bacterium]MDP6990787.1 glycosyltransferase family 4 protein [Planctomycetota bacterium]